MPEDTCRIRDYILKQERGMPITITLLQQQEGMKEKKFTYTSIKRVFEKLIKQGFVDRHPPLVQELQVSHEDRFNGGTFEPYITKRVFTNVYVVRKMRRINYFLGENNGQ